MLSPVGRTIGHCFFVLFLSTFFLAPSKSAAASGKSVSVFPAPGTPVASDTTTFSFRGVKPSQLGPIKVIGARSGSHTGRFLAHSDGRGVSFISKRRYVRGELVRVKTRKKIWGARNGNFSVRIGRFYGLDDTRGRPGPPNKFPALRSRPDLRPPKFDVLTRTKKAYPGRTFFAPKQTGLTILDSHGRINWFQPTSFGGNGQRVQDFRPQFLRGKQVATYWKGASTAIGFSQIGFFSVIDRNYKLIERFAMGNGYKPDTHSLILTPQGTAIAVAYRGVMWNASKFGGSKDSKILDNVVQEIDIKTGAVLFEWHSLGQVHLGASVRKLERDTPWDYFHINAAVNDGSDGILVSARHTNTIYRLKRTTGRLLWRLRGDNWKPKYNDFKRGPGTSFGYQHDIQRVSKGVVSLFDNGLSGTAGGMPAVNKESSGLVLKLSGGVKSPRQAKLVRRFKHKPDPVLSPSQGSMMLLPDGNGFIGWGSTSRFTEITPNGEIAYDVKFDAAPVNSYRARKAQWAGRPTGRPAIASRAAGNGGTVWASWNGATHIAKWRVMTGPDAKRLSEASVSPWKNLETGITVGSLNKVVRVDAIGFKGQVLGRSKPVKVGTQSR